MILTEECLDLLIFRNHVVGKNSEEMKCCQMNGISTKITPYKNVMNVDFFFVFVVVLINTSLSKGSVNLEAFCFALIVVNISLRYWIIKELKRLDF